MTDAMEVESPTKDPEVVDFVEEEDDEECNDLADLLQDATNASDDPTKAIGILTNLLQEPENRYGPMATSLKESAVYALARAYCKSNQYQEIVSLLTGEVCGPFFDNVTRAKCAKVVRAVLDTVCSLAPNEFDMVSSVKIIFNILEIPDFDPFYSKLSSSSKPKFVATLSNGVVQKNERSCVNVLRPSWHLCCSNDVSTAPL